MSIISDPTTLWGHKELDMTDGGTTTANLFLKLVTFNFLVYWVKLVLKYFYQPLSACFKKYYGGSRVWKLLFTKTPLSLIHIFC